MSNILLIPAARYIAAEMQLDYGLIPPVLLPLGTSTSLDYILNSFNYKKCILGLHDEYSRVEDYVKNKDISAELIYIPKDGNITKSNQLGFSILSMLNGLEFKEEDSLIINFGDTIVLNREIITKNLDEKNDFIFTSKVDDKYRWTSIVENNNGVSIFDKNIVGKPQDGHVVTGVFHIKNIKFFYELLQIELEIDDNDFKSTDIFYLALEKYLNQRSSYNIVCVDETDWIDLGHLDTFYKSKARFLNARHFNSFEIDLFWGKIIKKSDYKTKFIDEINWYINLPQRLKSLIPNIYSYSLETKSIFVEMEYYSYPTLNQIYLFSNISISQWREIFVKLLSIQNEFSKFYRCVDLLFFKAFYFEKTKQRLLDLRKDDNFLPYFDNKIVVNAKEYPSLNELIGGLESFIDINITNKEISAGIIHGDFCLSNILYDLKTGVVKLIDPRGSFIDNSVYGDPRYDLAKISHSVHGYYDLILNDNYRLVESEDGFDFEIHRTDDQENISNLFVNLMISRGIDVHQILAIESLLFLSMVPLHADNLRRQKAFLMRGLELYYSLF